MKPKPIFIIYGQIPDTDFSRLTKGISEAMPDYHIMILPNNKNEFRCELFSVNNATDIELEKLKQRIKPYLDEAINN
jgi:hypothetical protein